jgi:cullin 3
VLHKHGELLYEGVTSVIKDHLSARVERGVAKAPNERLLSELEALWDDHKRDMRRIHDILMYMVGAREGRIASRVGALGARTKLR